MTAPDIIALVEELKAALEPFARIADGYETPSFGEGPHDDREWVKATLGECRSARTALTRAEALLAGVDGWRPSVKPLGWVKRKDIAGLYNAPSSIGWWFNIQQEGDGKFTYTDLDARESVYPTLEAAKAAAQADYESRILSALSSPPSMKEPGA